MCPIPFEKQLVYNGCLVNSVLSTHMLSGMDSARNTKTTALGVSFSAIFSCESLDFGRQLFRSVCVDGISKGTATK